MNILPKKSWHVRTKKNIERVRRDEQNATEERKKEEARIALAEQEARTALLRKKKNNSAKECFEIELYKNHINIFKNEEEGKKNDGTNKEYELEKKAEKEKFEKSMGILTYLGQSSIEASASKPWYITQNRKHKDEDHESSEEKDLISKKFHDPLKDMPSHSHKTKKVKYDIQPKENSQKCTSGISKSIEQLRIERLQREKEERLRAEKLIAKHRGEIHETKEILLLEEHQQYNSQFFPHLARQNRTSK